MVDIRTLKVYVGKIIDWILYIGLVFGSTFLMMDCLIKYRNRSTYFEVTNKKADSVELPTITICFEHAYKQTSLEEFNISQFPVLPNSTKFSSREIFEKSAYDIGKDFEMSIADQYNSFVIDKLGHVDNSKPSLFSIEIKSMINQQLGKCYNMVLNPSQEDIKLAYIKVIITMKDHICPKPKKLKVSNVSNKAYKQDTN